MSERVYQDTPISEELYARAIGWEVVKYVKDYDMHRLARQMDSDAVALLKEIKAVLDVRTLDDPTCFYRVDALVQAFSRYGLYTQRHWELD